MSTASVTVRTVLLTGTKLFSNPCTELYAVRNSAKITLTTKVYIISSVNDETKLYSQIHSFGCDNEHHAFISTLR